MSEQCTLIVILESIMKKDNLSTLPNMFFSNANCARAKGFQNVRLATSEDIGSQSLKMF
jgi:hypothetical protein